MEALDLAALMEREEKLHPDLVPWVQPVGGHKFLNHPLVQETFLLTDKCALVNKRYELKMKMVAKALSNEEYHHYVFLHERPYRLDAFKEYLTLRRLDDRRYWQMVEAIWIDSENIWQHKKLWREMWREKRPGRQQYVMNDDERAAYDALPDIVTVYRGCNRAKHDAKGLSWTLDISKAEWFARRYQGLNLVLQGEVKKQHVYALLLGRNESEVICREVRNVTKRASP